MAGLEELEERRDAAHGVMLEAGEAFELAVGAFELGAATSAEVELAGAHATAAAEEYERLVSRLYARRELGRGAA